jgi:hypothetical protein
MKSNSSKTLTVLALASISGVVVSILMTVVSQLLHSNNNPISQSVSQLQFDPYGWIQRVSLVISGLTTAAFGVGLYFGMSQKRELRIVVILFLVMGIGQFVTAAFQPDMPGTIGISPHALVHQGGATVSGICFPIAGFLMLRHLRSDPRWGTEWARYTLIVVIATLVLELGREILLPFPWLDSWFGVYEKVLTVNSVVWLECMAFHLLRIGLMTKSGVEGA